MRVPKSRRFLFASVSFSRTIYAFVWYVMAAAFPAMAPVYHYDLQTLGFFTSAFLVGAGIFQIPAGIFSARRGATTTTLIGLGALSVASFASAASGEFYFQLVTRFASGVGAAFCFAPGLTIAASIIPRRTGLATGLYSAMFYLGAAIATFSFTLLSRQYGWQVPFVVTGVALFAALVQNAYAFRGHSLGGGSENGSARGTLTSRNIWAATAGLLGVSAVNYVVGQFLVTYLEQNLAFAAATAGTTSAFLFLGGMFGGPIMGWISDNSGRRRFFILIPALGTSLAVLSLTLHSAYALLPGMTVMGFLMSGAYTNTYAYPSQLRMDRRYAALAIALINTFGILYGSLAAPAFAAAAVSDGFLAAWVGLSVASLVTAPLVFLAAEPRRHDNAKGPG